MSGRFNIDLKELSDTMEKQGRKDKTLFMTTREKAEALEKIGPYEGTEVADFWYKLVDMYLYDKDYMSETFHLEIGVEIEIQYQDALDMIDDGDLEIPEDLLGTLV